VARGGGKLRHISAVKNLPKVYAVTNRWWYDAKPAAKARPAAADSRAIVPPLAFALRVKRLRLGLRQMRWRRVMCLLT